MSKQYNSTCQFQTISDASRTTGLSQYYIRKGCIEGTIPHIMAGHTKYMVNIPLMLQRLNMESEKENPI